MLGGMLRCESQSPRRRIRARIATWSFGVLIVGGAIVDATVLRREPTQRAANVEVQSTPEAQPTLPPQAEANVAELPAPAVRWLAASEPRPNNRLELDGIPYTIEHQRAEGLAVELRAPGCTHGAVQIGDERHELVDHRVAAVFPDGTYTLVLTCGDKRAVDTVLTVRKR